jgi:hypothetical protein
LARYLLNNHFEVASGPLTSGFLSGSWVGSQAAWLESKLESTKQWAQDSDENVRKWAAKLSDGLEATIPQIRQQEEEEWWD